MGLQQSQTQSFEVIRVRRGRILRSKCHDGTLLNSDGATQAQLKYSAELFSGRGNYSDRHVHFPNTLSIFRLIDKRNGMLGLWVPLAKFLDGSLEVRKDDHLLWPSSFWEESLSARSRPQVSDIAYHASPIRDYGLAPLRRDALLAWKLVRPSVQLAVVPPLLPYAANFRD